MPRPGPARSWIFKTEPAAVGWRLLARGPLQGGGVSPKPCFSVVFNVEREPGVPRPPKQNRRGGRCGWHGCAERLVLPASPESRAGDSGVFRVPQHPRRAGGGRRAAPCGPAQPPPLLAAARQAAVGCRASAVLCVRVWLTEFRWPGCHVYLSWHILPEAGRN